MTRERTWRVALAITAGMVTATCGSGDKSTGPGPPGPLHTIVVTPDTATIPIAGTVTLTATGKDAQGRTVTGLTFFWASHSDSLATVTQSGQVTGLQTGTVQIAASSQGISGFATLTVIPKAVGSIVVTPASATIRIATTLQLRDTVKDASGAVLPNQTVTWSSDSASTVSVDGNGLITGRQLGTATITASAGGKSAKSLITVSQIPVKSVTITPKDPAVSVSQTVQLTAVTFDSAGTVLPGRVVRWTSGTPAVATIDSIAGLVTGVTPGISVITATSEGVSAIDTVTVSPAPVNSVVLSPSVSQIHVGQSQVITATVTDINGNPVPGAVVTFATSDATIGSIASFTTSSAQILAGPNTGTATITGTSGPKKGTASVIVSQVPVDSVNVTAAHDTITVGHQDTLTATAFDSTGTALPGRPVTWKSSNPAVATVSATGIVTTLKAGTVVVFATISGVQGSVTILVNPVPVGSVTISPQSDTLLQSGQKQLTVTVRDSLGNIINNPQVTWFSSSSAVFVSTTGLTIGESPGTAQIIAQSGSKADTNTTLVLAPVANVSVTPGTSTITTAQTVQLTATLTDASSNILTGRTVQWTSTSNASVSQTGLVTPIPGDTGTATITATAIQPSGNVMGTATVIITQVPVATVTVTPMSSTITNGQTKQLTATLKDSSGNVLTGRTVQWSSSNAGEATVSASGLVTSHDTGTVTITATAIQASGNVPGSATVTITPVPVAKVIVAPATSTITTLQTVQLTDTLKDASNNVLTGRTVQWTSTSAATVSQTGLVTPSGSPGTDTITVTAIQASGNVAGSATVVITQVPVASVVVYPTPDTIFASAPGNTVQLNDSTYDAGHHNLPGRPVTWSPTSGGVATTNASGFVTATNTAAGTATITATSSDGPSGNGAVVVLGHSQSDTITVLPDSTLSPTGLLFPSSATATAKVIDQFGTDVSNVRMVTWSSSDPSTVTVSTAGPILATSTVTLTAISNNSPSVTITATTVDNPSATTNVTVTVSFP